MSWSSISVSRFTQICQNIFFGSCRCELSKRMEFAQFDWHKWQRWEFDFGQCASRSKPGCLRMIGYATCFWFSWRTKLGWGLATTTPSYDEHTQFFVLKGRCFSLSRFLLSRKECWQIRCPLSKSMANSVVRRYRFPLERWHPSSLDHLNLDFSFLWVFKGRNRSRPTRSCWWWYRWRNLS